MKRRQSVYAGETGDEEEDIEDEDEVAVVAAVVGKVADDGGVGRQDDGAGGGVDPWDPVAPVKVRVPRPAATFLIPKRFSDASSEKLQLLRLSF